MPPDALGFVVSCCFSRSSMSALLAILLRLLLGKEFFNVVRTAIFRHSDCPFCSENIETANSISTDAAPFHCPAEPSCRPEKNSAAISTQEHTSTETINEAMTIYLLLSD
jgi:hypothetical protein